MIIKDIPNNLRELLNDVIQPHEVDKWFIDKTIFNGKSPLDMLSVSNPEELRKNVEIILTEARKARKALTFYTVPNIPTVEEVYNEIVKPKTTESRII